MNFNIDVMPLAANIEQEKWGMRPIPVVFTLQKISSDHSCQDQIGRTPDICVALCGN